MKTKYWKVIKPEEADPSRDKYIEGWFRSAEPFVNELKQLARPPRLITLFCIAALAISGCAHMTPQQVQIVAATTAATVATVGTAASAFPNKHLTPDQIQAITNAAAQTAQLVGQAAANWTPAPSPTPAPAPSPTTPH